MTTFLLGFFGGVMATLSLVVGFLIAAGLIIDKEIDGMSDR